MKCHSEEIFSGLPLSYTNLGLAGRRLGGGVGRTSQKGEAGILLEIIQMRL